MFTTIVTDETKVRGVLAVHLGHDNLLVLVYQAASGWRAEGASKVSGQAEQFMRAQEPGEDLDAFVARILREGVAFSQGKGVVAWFDMPHGTGRDACAAFEALGARVDFQRYEGCA